MSVTELKNIVNQIAMPGKGILAADESQKTIEKRFASIKTPCTEAKRREYREMLFTANNLNKYISGVILYDETLFQEASTGITLGNLLSNQGILPGIKVDMGLVTLPYTDNEKVTQGLDNLTDRLINYKEAGAKFAKWRAVFDISDIKPSSIAIETNAHGLARYAALCQQQGIVPIVEPEVLMDGSHSLERCYEVTENVLHAVFHQLALQHVMLEGIILKPSMVIPGNLHSNKASINEVAHATVQVLLRTVPAAVRTINFLSGGQTAEEATAHLNAMHVLYPNLPWYLSFSYGRALQQPSLSAWAGNSSNIELGKKEMEKRARLNSAATRGEYVAEMENSN